MEQGSRRTLQAILSIPLTTENLWNKRQIPRHRTEMVGHSGLEDVQGSKLIIQAEEQYNTLFRKGGQCGSKRRTSSRALGGGAGKNRSTRHKAPVELRDGTAKMEATANLKAEDQRTDAIEQVVNELNPGQRPIQSIRCLALIKEERRK